MMEVVVEEFLVIGDVVREQQNSVVEALLAERIIQTLLECQENENKILSEEFPFQPVANLVANLTRFGQMIVPEQNPH